MIKLLDLLLENSYPFQTKEIERDDEGLLSVEYTFTTEKNTYKVLLSSFEQPRIFEVEFGVNRGSTNALDTTQMTGEGNALKILSTVADIINQFLNAFKKEYDKVVISGTDEKRKRVYRSFFPNKIDPKYSNKVVIK